MARLRLHTSTYSDVVYVEGVLNRDPLMERALFNHCKKYFDENYKGVFFVDDENKDDIFQNSFIALWDNILRGKIYVENGILKGKEGKAFTGKLTTYLMGIARLKYLEWTRENSSGEHCADEEIQQREQELEQYRKYLYDSDDEWMIDIISDCISHMSERCNEILTRYYYEEKSLDDIMLELPTFASKNALKTAKYKCLESLRESARFVYSRYVNA